MIDEKLQFFLDDDDYQEEDLKNEEDVQKEVQEEEEVDTPIEEQEDPEEEGEPIEGDVDTEYVKGIYEYLREQQLLAVPDDFEFNPSEEGLKEALEKTKENLYSSFLEEVPPEGKELLEYYRSGGRDIQEFMAMQQEPDYESIAVEDEDIAKAIIYNYYKATTAFSDQRIEKELQRLEENQELLEIAEESRQELQKIQTHRKAQLIEENKLRKEEQKKALEEAKQKVSKVVKAKNIRGIQIEEKEGEALMQSIFTPIKTKDGSVTTTLMMRLMQALSDPEEILILSKLASQDFKMDFLLPAAKVKANKDLTQKLKDLHQKKATKQLKDNTGGHRLDLSGPITLG